MEENPNPFPMIGVVFDWLHKLGTRAVKGNSQDISNSGASNRCSGTGSSKCSSFTSPGGCQCYYEVSKGLQPELTDQITTKLEQIPKHMKEELIYH